MLSLLGKALQLIGMLLLPLAIAMNLYGGEGFNHVSRMLIMMVFGIGVFYAGFILRGYGENEPE